jgi:hypothetical protein
VLNGSSLQMAVVVLPPSKAAATLGTVLRIPSTPSGNLIHVGAMLDGPFTDVTAGGRTFRAHRVVLAAASPEARKAAVKLVGEDVCAPSYFLLPLVAHAGAKGAHQLARAALLHGGQQKGERRIHWGIAWGTAPMHVAARQLSLPPSFFSVALICMKQAPSGDWNGNSMANWSGGASFWPAASASASSANVVGCTSMALRSGALGVGRWPVVNSKRDIAGDTAPSRRRSQRRNGGRVRLTTPPSLHLPLEPVDSALEFLSVYSMRGLEAVSRRTEEWRTPFEFLHRSAACRKAPRHQRIGCHEVYRPYVYVSPVEQPVPTHHSACLQAAHRSGACARRSNLYHEAHGLPGAQLCGCCTNTSTQ